MSPHKLRNSAAWLSKHYQCDLYLPAFSISYIQVKSFCFFDRVCVIHWPWVLFWTSCQTTCQWQSDSPFFYFLIIVFNNTIVSAFLLCRDMQRCVTGSWALSQRYSCKCSDDVWQWSAGSFISSNKWKWLSISLKWTKSHFVHKVTSSFSTVD